MSDKKRFNRRDFLKLGGLTALTIPTIKVVGRVGADEIVASQQEFGEFLIKRHAPDDPPYLIDKTLYARKPGHDTAFGRNPDKTMERVINTNKNLTAGVVGDDWLAYAYANGAATFMFDMQMYSWESTAVSPSQLPEGRWIPQEHGYTEQDATKIVKRAAKLYGASLAGIAPVNELWFYKDVADMNLMDMINQMTGGGSPPVSIPGASATEAQHLQQLLLNMEPKAFKDLMLEVMEDADATAMPMPPAMLKAMPAETFQQRLLQMMGNMDAAMLQTIKDKLDPELLADLPEPIDAPSEQTLSEMTGPPAGMDMGATVQAMAKAIVFSDDVDAPVITDKAKIFPRSMNRVIVMAFEMDEGGINTGGRTHMVSTLGEAAAQNGYSRMAFTSACLANFIRQLGYNAIPMGNDHSLSIPMAVDAGLGELGRNGVLITPKYGPRVRLAKVMTDMPLIPDAPISFGVTEFCEICGKCAELCPGDAISEGKRTFDAPPSGIAGLYHWPVDGDKCFAYWSEVGGSCYNCIRVCPFNKPESWLHEATRILIGAKSGTIDKILLKMDDAAGYGSVKGDDPADFWDKDTYIHIKS